MKSKFLRFGKSSLSIVLSLMMIFSTMLVGSINVDAVSIDLNSSGDVYSNITDSGDYVYTTNYTHAHFWKNGGNDFDNWPGFTMTKLTTGEYKGLYQVAIPKSGTTVADKVIFSNDGSGQTATLDVTANKVYDGGWKDLDGYKCVKVYYKNTNNWSNLCAYAWSGTATEHLGGYPGTVMKKVEDTDIYYIEVSVRAEKILFSDRYNGSNKTDDLILPTDFANTEYLYDAGNGGWGVYSTIEIDSVVAGTVTTYDTDENVVSGTSNSISIQSGYNKKVGSTVTVNTTCDSPYTVRGVTYTYTKDDDSTGTGTASIVTKNSQYSFKIPNDVKENSTITVNAEFGEPRTFKVTAYVDNTVYTNPGSVSISSNGTNGTENPAGSGFYELYVEEGSEVTLTITDSTPRSDDVVIDKWAISDGSADPNNPTNYSITSGTLVNDYRTASTHTIKIVPSSNIDATAYFKDDPGLDYGKYHVMFSTKANDDAPQNMTNAAQVKKTFSDVYFVSIPREDFTFTEGKNYFFCLSSSRKNTDMYVVNSDPHVEVDSSVSAYVHGEAKNGGYNWNGNSYHYAQFRFKNATVQSIKILLNDPSSANYRELDARYYKISAELSDMVEPVDTSSHKMVIAKDGTIRGSYTKFAKMADTKIDSADIDGVNYPVTDSKKINGNVVNTASFDGLSETVSLPKGSTVYFTTSINSSYQNKYYVKAFNVNGETIKATDNNDGTYSGEYTIPDASNIKYVEITPVYFYKLDSNNKTVDNVEVVTFYVENFDDAVKEAWGKPYNNNTTDYNSGTAVLSCYAWYQNNQGIDVLSYNNADKPALGGYPGQPMVYENGHYVMQLPKYVNGKGVMGITLNNYVWDYAHSYTLGAKSDGARETVNCQTYDYDDFVELAKLTDHIIFRFKYRTTENPSSGSASYSNRFLGNLPEGKANLSNFSTSNGYEVYTDYYGNVIDLTNEKITDGNTLYDTVSKVSNATHYTIVSDGYRDMYLGHFAVMWYIFDNSGNYFCKLPSSALFYEIYQTNSDGTYNLDGSGNKQLKAGITLDSNGKITTADNNPPASFITELDGSTRRGDWSNDSVKLNGYWAAFKKVYNNTKGVPAIITYETALRAQDSSSGSHPRDPGLRNDGRWYYSKANQTISAKILVQYKENSNDTTYTSDNFTTYSVSPYKYKTADIGAKAYFTNTDPSIIDENTNNDTIAYEHNANNIISNPENNFTFAADSTASKTVGDTIKNYMFEGWFLQEEDGTDSSGNPVYKYYEVNPNEPLKTTGSVPLTGNPTLVARYVPLSDDNLVITHDLYKDAYKYSQSVASHTGSGTPSVNVQVIDTSDNNKVVTTFKANISSDNKSAVINKSMLDKFVNEKYQLKITLDVVPDGDSTFETIYRKYNSEETTETTPNNSVGYEPYTSTDKEKGAVNVTFTPSTLTTNSTTNANTVTYTCSVSDLFSTQPSSTQESVLKTKVIRFYSDLSKAMTTIQAQIIVEYKDTVNSTTYTTDDFETYNTSPYKYKTGDIGAKAYFTNTDTSITENSTSIAYEYDVDNVYDDSSKNFTFEADTTASKTVGGTTTNYIFEGWFLRTNTGTESNPVYTYTAINPNDPLKSTGSVSMTGNPTLVARYAPLSDDELVITHQLYKDDAHKYSKSPNAHNGGGTPTVNVQVIDTTNNTVVSSFSADISADGETATINKSVLDKFADSKYQLKVTLDVEPETGSELETVYRKYNSEEITETDSNDTVGYEKYTSTAKTTGAVGVTFDPSALTTTGTKKTVTYTCSVSDLFSTQPSSNQGSGLKTNVIRFYSDLKKTATDFTVVFKYFDRNTNNNSHAETVNTIPTVITVNNLAFTESFETTINNAMVTKGQSSTGSKVAVNSITSVIDDYEFWPSQSAAVTAFGNKTNLHSADHAASYKDSGNDLTCHADYYGYTKDETGKYNIEATEIYPLENWVTYYNLDGTKTMTETEANADPTSVGKVVVWGFNTPKTYNIYFNMPKNENMTLSEVSNNIYFASNSELMLKDFTGFYNERVGISYSYAGIDDLSPYLKNVYGLTSSSTGNIGEHESITAPSSAKAVIGEVETALEFDGWYDTNGSKVSSDLTFANRVMADTTLKAGYRVKGGNKPTGITVSKNQTERYVDANGNERVRIVTMVNAYGYPDHDENIKDIAIIYVKLANGVTLSDNQLSSLISSDALRAAIYDDLTAVNRNSKTVTTFTVTVSSVNNNAISYSYDVEPTQNDDTNTGTHAANIAKLTNKNRVQFSLDLDSASVDSENGSNSNIAAFAAITYGESLDFVASDNFVTYVNGD